MCIHVCTQCVHACLCTRHRMLLVVRGQSMSHFSPLTLWVPGINLRSSVLTTITLSHSAILLTHHLNSCTVVEEQYKEAEGRGGIHLEP